MSFDSNEYLKEIGRFNERIKSTAASKESPHNAPEREKLIFEIADVLDGIYYGRFIDSMYIKNVLDRYNLWLDPEIREQKHKDAIKAAGSLKDTAESSSTKCERCLHLWDAGLKNRDRIKELEAQIQDQDLTIRRNYETKLIFKERIAELEAKLAEPKEYQYSAYIVKDNLIKKLETQVQKYRKALERIATAFGVTDTLLVKIAQEALKNDSN